VQPPSQFFEIWMGPKTWRDHGKRRIRLDFQKRNIRFDPVTEIRELCRNTSERRHRQCPHLGWELVLKKFGHEQKLKWSASLEWSRFDFRHGTLAWWKFTSYSMTYNFCEGRWWSWDGSIHLCIFGSTKRQSAMPFLLIYLHVIGSTMTISILLITLFRHSR
jgi:hypothetical protein